MLNRFLKVLKKNNILYKYQFGLRKNHAITHALTEVIDYIYRPLDEGDYVFGIYIDLNPISPGRFNTQFCRIKGCGGAG